MVGTRIAPGASVATSWRWLPPAMAGLLSACGIGYEPYEPSYDPCASPSVTNEEGIESLQSCTWIGDLSIGGELTSLHDLEHVTRVRSLTVAEFCNLRSLHGLSQLRFVEDHVDIQCKGLKSLEGLGELETGGAFVVEDTLIEDLRGLGQVTTRTLVLRDNELLASLEGLGKGASDDEVDVRIELSPGLKSLEGLTLENVRSLRILETGVMSLRGLESWKRIPENLWIVNNPNLTTLRGVESVEQVGKLGIALNPELVELSALARLVGVRSVEVRDNPRLVSLGPLLNLPPGSLTRLPLVTKNAALSQCEVQEFFETQFPGSGRSCSFQCASNDERACQ